MEEFIQEQFQNPSDLSILAQVVLIANAFAKKFTPSLSLQALTFQLGVDFRTATEAIEKGLAGVEEKKHQMIRGD